RRACTSTWSRWPTTDALCTRIIRSWKGLEHAMSDERHVAAHLYRFNAVRGPLRKHAQFAWAAGELALVQDEAVAAADQPMAEAVGADRGRRARRGHTLAH